MTKKILQDKETENISQEKEDLSDSTNNKFFEVKEKENSFDLVGVELYKLGTKGKGINFDKSWTDKAIEIHNKNKTDNNYLPTVFIGHNSGHEEKPSVGFLDNIRITGGRVLCDILNIKNKLKEQIAEFPYRSMEIFDGNRIAGLALLGSNAPYHKTEPIVLNEEAESKVVIPLNYSEEEEIEIDIKSIENNLTNNNQNQSMNKIKQFKEYVKGLSTKDKLVQKDIDTMDTMFGELNDEEKMDKDVISLKEAVIIMFNTEEKEDNTNTDNNNTKVEDEEETKEDDKTDEKTNTKKDETNQSNTKLNEKDSEILKLQEQIVAMQTERRMDKTVQKFNELVAGHKIRPALKDKVVNLAMEMSEKQASLFYEILETAEPKLAKYFSEMGIQDAKKVNTKDKEKQYQEAREKAKSRAKDEGITFAEALRLEYRQLED